MNGGHEVTNFLIDLSKNGDREEVSKRRERILATGKSDGIPYDDFAYGEALWRWYNDNKNPRSFFSTEDPYLIEYAKELTEKFELPVMSRKEGLEYEKSQSNVFRKWICGVLN